MITKTGVVTEAKDALDLLKDTNLDDALLIYDFAVTDMVTVGDFIAALKKMTDPPGIDGLIVAIGHKRYSPEPSKEMEVSVSKSR